MKKYCHTSAELHGEDQDLMGIINVPNSTEELYHQYREKEGGGWTSCTIDIRETVLKE